MKTFIANLIFILLMFHAAWGQQQRSTPLPYRQVAYGNAQYWDESQWQKATRATLLHANDKQVPRMVQYREDGAQTSQIDTATLACAVEVHDDGTVTARWGDGSSYCGEVFFGEIRGKGTMIYPDGSRYEGAWEADLPNGEGVFTDSTGTTYAVRWIDGLPHGKGSIVQPDGTRYAARWRNGKLRPKSVKSFEPQPSFEP